MIICLSRTIFQVQTSTQLLIDQQSNAVIHNFKKLSNFLVSYRLGVECIVVTKIEVNNKYKKIIKILIFIIALEFQ